MAHFDKDQFIADCRQAGDTEAEELFLKAQADSRKGAEMGKALSLPEVKEAFARQGMDVAPSASPEAFGQHMRAEQERLSQLIRAAGIQPE